MSTLQRRTLVFTSLDDAVREAEQLQMRGYQRAGNWDLAQCCRHLALWMTYPIDGFPQFPLLLRPVAAAYRATLGPKQLRRILDSGVWPPGGPTDKRTIPAPGEDEAAAVAALREAAERLQTYDGPLYPSPVFGPLDKGTLIKLHRLHTAHHLGYLIPNE